MKFKKNILARFFGGNSKSKAHRIFIQPIREWAICLLMGVLCSFLLFGYIGLNFYQQYLDVDQVTVVDQSVLKYRSSDAENVVEKYKDKEREFDVLYKEYMSLKKSAPTSDIVMASEKVHTTEDTGLADDIVAQ